MEFSLLTSFFCVYRHEEYFSDWHTKLRVDIKGSENFNVPSYQFYRYRNINFASYRRLADKRGPGILYSCVGNFQSYTFLCLNLS